MTTLGRQLGKDVNASSDTTGRLRDDFEAIDYFETNSEKITFSTYNIKIDIGSVVGSNLFILSHEAYGRFGTGKLGSGDLTTNRNFEYRIWEEWDESFTATGSRDSTFTDVTWDTSGSLDFTTGSGAASLRTSNGVDLATLNKVKINVTGSNTAFLVGSATLDGSNWEGIGINEWDTLTNTGSDARWRLVDTTGSSIITNVIFEWKSNDI